MDAPVPSVVDDAWRWAAAVREAEDVDREENLDGGRERVLRRLGRRDAAKALAARGLLRLDHGAARVAHGDPVVAAQ